VRDGRWKYFIGGFDREELYDLVNDPEERTNLAQRDRRRAGALRARLRAWVEEHPFTVLDPGVLDEELKEDLRALGYL
jgi:hypothetical protein